jgi:uncharacterized membrane protein YwzB
LICNFCKRRTAKISVLLIYILVTGLSQFFLVYVNLTTNLRYLYHPFHFIFFYSTFEKNET